MPIEPITLAEFESLRLPAAEDRAWFGATAGAWYGTPDRKIVGVIHDAMVPPRICYAAFRNEDGAYRLLYAGVGAATAADALVDLTASILHG